MSRRSRILFGTLALLVVVFLIYRDYMKDLTKIETDFHLIWVKSFAEANDLEVVSTTGSNSQWFGSTHRYITFVTKDQKLIHMNSQFQPTCFDVELVSVKVEVSDKSPPKFKIPDRKEIAQALRDQEKEKPTVQLPVERIRKNEPLKLSEFFPDRFPKKPE